MNGPGRAALGRIGEDLAVGFLRARGAAVVARNVRSGRGEIDVLADIEGRRVAVEVKTRVGGEPVASFTPAKLAAVRTAARGLRPPVFRIDFVGVTVDGDGVTIRWIPNAG